MSVKVYPVWDEEKRHYVLPLGDERSLRTEARHLVLGGSISDIKVYDDKGSLVAKVMRPGVASSWWFVFDPCRAWKKDVIRWLTGARPGRREPLRFRRWSRQPDGSWKKSIWLP